MYVTRSVEIVHCPVCHLAHDLPVELPPIIHEWVTRQDAYIRPIAFVCPGSGDPFERDIVIDIHYGRPRATDYDAWYGDENYLSEMSEGKMHLMDVQLGLVKLDPGLLASASSILRL